MTVNELVINIHLQVKSIAVAAEQAIKSSCTQRAKPTSVCGGFAILKTPKVKVLALTAR